MVCRALSEGCWCPYCYEGVRGRRWSPGHVGPGRSRYGRPRGKEMKYVSRPVAEAAESEAARAPGWSPFAKDYPALWEYLSAVSWEDGTSRETSTVLLFTEDGRVKACLHDRAEARSLWSSGEGVEGALGALEHALETGQAEWRRSRSGVRGRAAKGG
jgi:hypothetical protein